MRLLLQDFGDLIGAILFPFGAYFPGFTFSAILTGAIYGLFLYKKPNDKINNIRFIINLILSSILVLGLVKIFVDSLWINMLCHKAYLVLISTRATIQVSMLPIQIVLIFALDKVIRPYAKKYLYEEKPMDIEEYLSHFDKFTKDPTLDVMKWLMNEFGNPHKKIKFVHVAGTNGKGSVCEMLNNVLIKSGYTVGKFISPHLIKFNDGIYINNKEISDDDVEEILILLSKKVEEYNQTHQLKVKWFEIITSLTLIYFAKKNCDIVVLETGLGGTTDCTNIVDSLVSIITNIGYDHMDVLGDSIEEITGHKAGIIKENSETVVVYQKGITEIIEKVCKEKNSKLHIINEDDIQNYSYDQNFQKFDYKNNKAISINLKGKKQIYNASQVLECIEILKTKGYKIPEEAIREGLRTVIHKARLETLSKNPLVVFDGGHNENAIKNLKENIEQYYSNYKTKVYIISILKTKDYKTIVKHLVENEDAVFFFTDGNSKKRYVSKKDLYNEALKYANCTKLFKNNLLDAIDIAKKLYKDDLILIVGSFYVYKDVVGGKND